MLRKSRLSGVVLLGWCAVAWGSQACDESTPAAHAENDLLSGIQVTEENDFFGKLNKDRWYTNGLKYSWTHRHQCHSYKATQWLREASHLVMWDDQPQALSYSVGQLMYTPDDINLRAYQPDDRPYSAFLYASATGHAFKDQEFRSLELKLGTTGRMAGGQEAQTAIHWAVNSDRPQGWRNQLQARPGVQISCANVHMWGAGKKEFPYMGFQFGYGTSVGNIRDYVDATAAVVLADMSKRTTPVLVGNEGDFSVNDTRYQSQLQEPFAYMAITGTAIAYNYFIQGQSSAGASNLARKNNYATVQTGVSIPVPKLLQLVGIESQCKWRLAYAQSVRSPEFF